MKTVIPAFNGQPIINDDVVALQNWAADYFTAILKDFTSPTGYVKLSGIVISEPTPGNFTWTGGYIWNIADQKVRYCKEQTTPVALSDVNDLAIDTGFEMLTAGDVLNESGTLVQTYRHDYVFLMEDNAGSLLSDTPTLAEALAAIGLLENSLVDWANPTLNSGWTGLAGHRRTPGGMVEVQGLVSNPTITALNRIIFTLPAALRNDYVGSKKFLCFDAALSVVFVNVDSNGDVWVDEAVYSSVTFLDLSPILFPFYKS
jgi:hypothetical protein